MRLHGSLNLFQDMWQALKKEALVHILVYFKPELCECEQ